MNDATAMRVFHSVAHSAEQLQPIADGEALFVTVAVDRNSLHEIHHQVRESFTRGATVEQGDDIWMIQFRQGLTLGEEALVDLDAFAGRSQHFYRHAFLVMLICALGEIDDRGSASTQFAKYSIVA